MTIKGDFLKNHFKEKIKKGEFPLGIGMETTSPDVAEVLATTDYDWLFIDGEHGPHTVQTILQIARTIAFYEMTPVVRIGDAWNRNYQATDGFGNPKFYFSES